MRFLALIAATCLFAATAQASDLALIHATVYTSPDAPPLKDATVLIHDGKIAAVAHAIKTPATATIIDCTGLTITAGFWNSHVHILPPQLLHAEGKSDADIAAQLQIMFTHWGFTTVFDIASVLANTNNIRGHIASGKIDGPRILTTGEPFWGPGGTPVYVAQYLKAMNISIPDTESASQAITRVDQQVHDGADGIKIFAGSIESDGVHLLQPGIAKAVVAEAHKDHRLVFAHPSSIKGVNLSIDSGVDILAHVSSDEGPWTPALVQRMLAAHMSLIPTLTLFGFEMQKGNASPEATQALVTLATGQLRSYASSGGQILFGTDIGYIDHYDTAEEFTLMSRAGMTFPQILASLTTNPAKRFGYTHTGRVAPDMDADLTILKSDPAADITALSHVAYTIRDGKVIYAAK